MSGDIADSPVMKKIDHNRGLMIIRDASRKHIQPLTLAYFRRDLIKIWWNIHLTSTFMRFCFDLWCNYGDDPFHFLQEVKKRKFSLLFIASNIHHFNNWHIWNIKSILFQY